MGWSKFELENMPYPEFLLHPVWLQVRYEVCRRDESVCQMCGLYVRYGHVHHLTYKKGRLCPLEFLIWCCPSCHKAEHAKWWAQEPEATLADVYRKVRNPSLGLNGGSRKVYDEPEPTLAELFQRLNQR